MSPPVLLVEDDPFLADALKDFFNADGLELHIAASAQEARRKIAAFGVPVLVLVDPATVELDGNWIRRVAAMGHPVMVIAVAIHDPRRRSDGLAPPTGPERRVIAPESLLQMVHELRDPARADGRSLAS